MCTWTQDVHSQVKVYEWVTSLLDARHTSEKVFIVVCGLTAWRQPGPKDHQAIPINEALEDRDAFAFWCRRRLSRVPCTARRSNQSILKEINLDCSLEGLTLKLKFQFFAHLMGRANSLEKTLMLGQIEGRRRRGHQRMRWLDGITDSTDMSLSKLQRMWRTGKPGVLQSIGSQRPMTEQLNNNINKPLTAEKGFTTQCSPR